MLLICWVDELVPISVETALVVSPMEVEVVKVGVVRVLLLVTGLGDVSGASVIGLDVETLVVLLV